MYLLVIYEILNCLLAHRLPITSILFIIVRTWCNQIQVELSKKEKTFSEFSDAFPKPASHFQHFEQKDDPHSLCISEITDCKRRG